MPEKLFPDHAFAQAVNTNRKIMRLVLAPGDLEYLKDQLAARRLTRHTAFDNTPSPKGAVPARLCRYRGADVITHNSMKDQFLAEFTNGSVQYYDLDDKRRALSTPRFP